MVTGKCPCGACCFPGMDNKVLVHNLIDINRGVGATMASLALAIVDFGPTYLVGLLRANYSCRIYVSSTTMH